MENLTKKNNAECKYDLIQVLSACCSIIASSENQELIYHSQNTVHWAGILSSNNKEITTASIKPEDRKLEIAAFAHEIERATANSLNPHNFQSYNLYKYASTVRSSEILEKIMKNFNIDQKIISEIVEIMILSSSDDKSNEKACILREADILSFFKISLQHFFITKISDKLLQEICIYEFKRLSDRAKQYLVKLNFSDVRLKYYINSIAKENAFI